MVIYENLICDSMSSLLKYTKRALFKMKRIQNSKSKGKWYCIILKKNPRSKPSSSDKFSICHWNLNCVSADIFIKIYLLRAYISTQNFDILCLSEIYFDSSISSNNISLASHLTLIKEYISSIINEVIKGISSLFIFFFYEEIFTYKNMKKRGT